VTEHPPIAKEQSSALDRALGTTDRATAGLSALLMAAGAALLVVLMFWIVASVLARNIGGFSVRGTPEVAANGVVAISLLCAPYVVRHGGHIRTGVLIDRLPPAGKRVASGIAHLIGAAVFAFLAWAAWDPMLTSWATGEYSGEGSLRIPTAPLRTIVVLFALVMSVELILSGLKKPSTSAVGSENADTTISPAN
jgi:TRAP-type C4-dicarboxylate transport system permease small subunit